VVHQLLERGRKVVAVDIVQDPQKLSNVRNQLTYIQADVCDLSLMLSALTSHAVKEIYHLGAMLSSVSEKQHWKSFQTNVAGTMQLFELAITSGVKKFFFASSRGTFGRTPDRLILDTSQQLPTHFYGWGKLYCEGIGGWHHINRGLDFRCLRYPTIVGPNIRTEGHWAPAMIEDVIAGKEHRSIYGNAGSVGFFLHIEDAARATLDLMAAPSEKIISRVYNVAGLQQATTARQLADRLNERFVNAKITLAEAQEKKHTISYVEFRDEAARAEWNWAPRYGTLDALIDKFAM